MLENYGYLSKVAYKLMKDSEEKHDSAKKFVETNNSSIEKGRAENIDKDLFKGGIFVEYKGGESGSSNNDDSG